MSLQSGLDAFKQGRYQVAIHILEEFSQTSLELNSPDYLTAQMWLMQAYQKNGELEQSKIIWQKLINSDKPQVREWAERYREFFTPTNQPSQQPKNMIAKAGRAATAGVSLKMGSIGGNLALASGITIALLFGMVFVLGLGVILITTSSKHQ